MNRLKVILFVCLLAGCSKREKNDMSKAGDPVSSFISNFSTETYEGDGGVYKDIYFKDSLVLKTWYDSTGVLQYQTPVDLNLIQKTSFYLVSGRNYFDQDKMDTIILVNKGLPYYNRGIVINGAILSRLTDTSYSIRSSKHFDDLKELKIEIKVFQRIGSKETPGVIFDSISIPVK